MAPSTVAAVVSLITTGSLDNSSCVGDDPPRGDDSSTLGDVGANGELSFAPTQDPVGANNKLVIATAVVMVIVATPIDDMSIGGDDPSCCDKSSQQEDVGAIEDSLIAPTDTVATNNELLFVAAVVEYTKAQPLDD